MLTNKVLAYITHGNRLLVFSHSDHPDAGIQVPAGTVRPGESPDEAVLREAAEETGLKGLQLDRFLGEQYRDMSDYGRREIRHRRFYHLRYPGDPPETWRHAESDPSDGSKLPITFDFFWVTLPDGLPELVADHAFLVPRLIEVLQTSSAGASSQVPRSPPLPRAGEGDGG